MSSPARPSSCSTTSTAASQLEVEGIGTLDCPHRCLMRLVLDWDGTVTERDTLHMAIERFGDLDVFRALEAQIGRELTLNEVIGIEMATITRAVRRGARVAARHGHGAAGSRRARRRPRPADRLGGVPRADRAGARARRRRRDGRRESPRAGARRLAGGVPRAGAVRGVRRAVQARRARRAPSRTSTSATASPTAASRSPPSGSSRVTASPAGSTGRASPTRRSPTCTTSRA